MPPRAKLNFKPKAAPLGSKAGKGGATATTTATTVKPSCSLKTADLKTLLALIGSPTSGTKPTLVSRFDHDVAAPKLMSAASIAPRGAGSGSSRQRILSVDMGIRNLAFCVADVEIGDGSGKLIPQSKSKGKSKTKTRDIAPDSGPPINLSVVAWERIAVQELTATEDDGNKAAEGEGEEEAAAVQEKESFLPAALSRIAYSLLTRKLLPHAPSTLLIEQQRYRSQGSSAVQEWTYRVNMLEGMLWAVLETLRAEEIKIAKTTRHDESSPFSVAKTAATTSTSFPPVTPLPSPHAVSPQRVATFWMTSTPLGRALMAAKQPRHSSRSGKQSARLKIDKRDKISFLSAWLAHSSGSDAVAIPSIVDAVFGDEGAAIASNEVDVSFTTAAAAATRDAFLDKMVGKVRGRRKKTTTIKTTTTTGTAAVAGDDGQAQGQSHGGVGAEAAAAAEEEETVQRQQQQNHHLGTRPRRAEAGKGEGHGERGEAVQQQAEDREHESGEPCGGAEAAAAPSSPRGGALPKRRARTKLQGQGQGRENEHALLAHEQHVSDDPSTATTTSTTTTTTTTAASITQERDIGKLDDLADCLLQAAAWARWEGNRRVVHGLADDDDALRRFAHAFARGDGTSG